jgi:recombination protein RecR
MPQPPNLNKMLQQAQEMLAAQQEAQEGLKEERVEASAGGGMVKVVASGDLRVQSIAIDPDAVDPEDVEMLQDMVTAAVNEALRQAEELQQSRLAGAGGGGGFDPMSALEALGGGGLGGLGGLGRLPGIGGRTAQRLAFHLLRATDDEANALADAIREVKATIRPCEVCFNLADGPRCRVCLDERRDPSVICVVEEAGDIIPVERTHEFRGRYHVLGGALSPIDGVDPEDLHLAELYERVVDAGITEVVIATNSTTTGEATALHIADTLRERAPEVAVTRLASGLPVGADLEYADEVTLGKAFAGRRRL